MIEKIVAKRGAKYPLYLQESIAIEDRMVFAKLFNAFGS